jgi:hypothetical protein
MFFRLLRSLEGLESRNEEALMLGGGIESSIGYALRIDVDGQHGSTAPCESFGSPALMEPVSSEGADAEAGARAEAIVQFEVAKMEVILITDTVASVHY